MIDSAICMSDELEKLRSENESLEQQIKMLIRAEGRIYGFQEKLDNQIKTYKSLYELNKNINSTFDIDQIFNFALDYVIHYLEYERVFFLKQNEQTGTFSVSAFEGYYDDTEEKNLLQLELSEHDPLIRSLKDAVDYRLWKKSSPDPEGYRQQFQLDEFYIYPLGSQVPHFAFMVVGNSHENSGFYHLVDDSEDELLRVGNLAGLLSSRVDSFVSFISMKKALEQEQCAEMKFRNLFENASEGIIQVYNTGEVLSCNPAAAVILGYSDSQEVMNEVNFNERLFVNLQRQEELATLLSQGQIVHNFEAELWRRDGSRYWVQIGARPVMAENGEILSVDGILLDISERKKAETELHNLNEGLEQRVKIRTCELEDANQGLHSLTKKLEKTLVELKSAQSKVLQQEKMASIGQLAAGVAHEINNPMGYIISNINTLKKYLAKISKFIQLQTEAVDGLAATTNSVELIDQLTQERKQLKLDFILEDQNELIDESLEGAERVKQIVQNLKSFSRIDDSDFCFIDINECLESTIRVVWNELKYKVTLVKDLGALPDIYGNRGQLSQVFMNLLVNAAHAIETKGEISITTAVADKHVLVTVADTGSGIPQQQLKRIFEPFYTTKDVGQGTGLGLSIVYDIVKKHDGEIWVESELGKGTSFTLSFPLDNEESASSDSGD